MAPSAKRRLWHPRIPDPAPLTHMHDGVACAQRDEVLLRGVGDEEAATVVAAVLAERDDHRHERLLVAVDAVATALARSVPPY